MIFIALLTKCNCIPFINTKKALVTIHLVTSSFIFCQECNLKIKGYIIDSNSNSVLKGAVIQIVGKEVNTISNDDGSFLLENLCVSDNELKISHINCDQVIKKIDFSESLNVIIIMNHKVEALDEVIISEKKIISSSTAKIFSLSEIEKDRYSNSGLSGAISQISGVTTLSTGGNISQPVIHGMFGSRVGIIYDGILLENQQWGGDHGLGFTDLGIGKVELIKGPASIMFGADALAGALYFVDDSYVSSGQCELKLVSNFESALMRYNNQIISKWAKNKLRMNTYAEYGSAADYRMPNGNYLFNSRYNNLAL